MTTGDKGAKQGKISQETALEMLEMLKKAARHLNLSHPVYWQIRGLIERVEK